MDINNISLRNLSHEPIKKIEHIINLHPSIVNQLDQYQNTLLHFATEENNLALINLLIKNKSNIDAQNINGCTPLMIATILEYKEVVNVLLDIGANPNIQDNNGYSSLHKAALVNRLDIMQDLIAHNGKIDLLTKEGKSLLHCSAYEATTTDNFNLVKYLINHGADYSAADHDGNMMKWYFGMYDNGLKFENLVKELVGDQTTILEIF